MSLRAILAGAVTCFALTACATVETETKTTETTTVTETAETKTKVSEVLTPRAERIKADMSYLASDELEGRDAGSEGHVKAVAYVIDQFKAIGVAPLGEEGGYEQHVPLNSVVRAEEGNSLTVTGADGTTIPFVDGEDYVVSSSKASTHTVIEAPIVFAGYGVVAPEHGLDPYKDLDVKGKIVAVLSGTPAGIQTEERAYYGAQTSREMSERGAIGVITLETPRGAERYPFARAVASATTRISMSWIGKDGNPYTTAPNLQASAYVSQAGAAKLFDGADMSWEEIIKIIEDEAAPVPSFELPFSAKIEQTSVHERKVSDNVIGVIEGADPVLKDQIIVLSAHLDHIGITKQSMEDDVINNGALDNAAGVSTLLEAARIIKSAKAPPRRTIVFAVVTAEEKGLLGAQYFAQNPTFDRDRMVANVNLDMPVLTYDFMDVVAFGGERSTMKSAIEEAISNYGVTLGEDPFPSQGLFTRSDHYRFVEIGVPSVFLATGFANGGEEAWTTHFAKNYHKPSDEIDNGVLFNVADKFASINAKIAMTLANQDERPMWVKDDFFALKFGGVMAEE